MQVTVISDVHGNAFALEAVLEDLSNIQSDFIINLGDQVSGRANPKKAYELQAGLQAYEILGSAEPSLRKEDAFHLWLRSQIGEKAVQRLMALPLSARLLDGEIYACHGAPEQPNGHLFWAWQRGPYQARSAQSLREMIQPFEAKVVLCGHTHREAMTVLDDTLVVNVGAVGSQVDGDPKARWALLEYRAGRWSVDFRRVKYDWYAASQWVLDFAPDPEAAAAYLLTGE